MSMESAPDDLSISKPKPRSIISDLIVHGLAWMILVAVLALGVPKVEAVFKDFGVDLPVISTISIKASHFLISYAYLAGPLILLLLVVDGFVLSAASDQNDGGNYRAWSILMFAIPVLAIGVILAGLALPLISLVSKLSG